MPARRAKVAKVWPEIVDASQRHDPGCHLCWFPLARAEVVQIEVGATQRRKQQLGLSARWDPFERFERNLLQRHGADAALGLGALEPAVSERAPHVHDARLAVDVALLERDPFSGP